MKMTEQLEENKQRLDNKFNIYQIYVDIYNLWNDIIRVKYGISAEHEANQFITNIAKAYSPKEIEEMSEEYFISILMHHFDYKLQEMREKTDDMYYYIRDSMENNDINKLYKTLQQYSKYQRIDI